LKGFLVFLGLLFLRSYNNFIAFHHVFHKFRWKNYHTNPKLLEESSPKPPQVLIKFFYQNFQTSRAISLPSHHVCSLFHNFPHQIIIQISKNNSEQTFTEHSQTSSYLNKPCGSQSLFKSKTKSHASSEHLQSFHSFIIVTITFPAVFRAFSETKPITRQL
jgi:hypothetical protein